MAVKLMGKDVLVDQSREDTDVKVVMEHNKAGSGWHHLLGLVISYVLSVSVNGLQLKDVDVSQWEETFQYVM